MWWRELLFFAAILLAGMGVAATASGSPHVYERGTHHHGLSESGQRADHHLAGNDRHAELGLAVLGAADW